MQLAEPPCGAARGLAGVEERRRRSAPAGARGGARRRAPRPRPAPARSHRRRCRRPASAPPAAARPTGGRRARARRARSRRCPASTFSAGGLDETVDERRPQDRLVAAHRIGQADRARVGVGRDEAPRVGLAEAGADEDVLDDAGGAAARGRGGRRPRAAAASSSARGRARSRATSSTTSISRVTSRARQVGTVTFQSSATSKPSRSRMRPLLGRRDLDADDPVGALRPQPDDGARRQAGVDVGAAASARRR